eukprot:1154236-Pelagomonas_calceolata.AAC.19
MEASNRSVVNHWSSRIRNWATVFLNGVAHAQPGCAVVCPLTENLVEGGCGEAAWWLCGDQTEAEAVHALHFHIKEHEHGDGINCTYRISSRKNCKEGGGGKHHGSAKNHFGYLLAFSEPANIHPLLACLQQIKSA